MADTAFFERHADIPCATTSSSLPSTRRRSVSLTAFQAVILRHPNVDAVCRVQRQAGKIKTDVAPCGPKCWSIVSAEALGEPRNDLRSVSRINGRPACAVVRHATFHDRRRRQKFQAYRPTLSQNAWRVELWWTPRRSAQLVQLRTNHSNTSTASCWGYLYSMKHQEFEERICHDG